MPVVRRKFAGHPEHRKMMMRIQVTQLFKHERIQTTYSKARETARFAERMITFAKRGDPRSKKLVFSFINEKEQIEKLYLELADRFKDRVGGYTRVFRTGWRKGDGAPLAVVELVDNPLTPLPPASQNRAERERKRKEYNEKFKERDDEKIRTLLSAERKVWMPEGERITVVGSLIQKQENLLKNTKGINPV
eukprot:TRINITY_DN1623_c0_g2_i1.p1 TRINITY_DN1623_c0_g2~~TRINITY_DN1623_c0_g2_i1.p1  ORF type:complete len:192 (-),score=37.14 TRINITY_DN1623_c0_g2_i1:329-904(-)